MVAQLLRCRRGLKAVAAVGLLAALYWHCDWRRVAEAFQDLDAYYLLAACLLFVPQTLVSAWRWQRLAAPLCAISLGEATRQTLAASAWNLITPSKLGDLTKAAMLPVGAQDHRRAVPLVVAEKVSDVAALLLLWLAGAFALIAPQAALLTSLLALTCLPAICWRPGNHCVRIPQSAIRNLPISLLLWLLHLAQIHLLLLAAGVPVGLSVSLARVPAAIFAGLAPITLFGLGTRDGALVWLFSDVASVGAMAAVGLLTALRYLVPGAAGIACLWSPPLVVRRESGILPTVGPLRP